MVMFGVDIGGTFTDSVVFDEESGELSAGKVPTTPTSLADGLMAGLDALNIDLSAVTRGIHGTTVATNAAIERTGARTVGVFTEGFRDVLAIGTGQRFTGGLFDTRFRRASPLIARSASLEVQERVQYDGAVLRPVDEDALRALLATIKEQAAEAVAVCFLNSYVNDANERSAVDMLRRELPEAFVCGSAEVLPQVREYERFTTAAFNAYLGPVVQRYVRELSHTLAARGYQRDLLIMTSNGGVSSAAQAARVPVSTVLSGAAGGVSGGSFVARVVGVDNFITFDMGGTSADVCVVKGGRTRSASHRIVSGLPLRWPQLDINTVGAGGGSIAWIDTDGRFAVGPKSAGAMPGPACYGEGGYEATVTDANVVLGRIGKDTRLGGSVSLRAELALRAVEHIARQLGDGDVNFVADGILRIADANSAAAIREISVERGEDPRLFTLLAFGGAGPMHACSVAQEVGISRVVVPSHPGNLAALGLLTSDLKHEFVQTYLSLLPEADMSVVAERLHELGKEADSLLASEGVAKRDRHIRYSLEMRYEGQAHELEIEASPDGLDQERLGAAFSTAYFQAWSYSPVDRPIQLVNLRVLAVGRAPTLTLPHLTNKTKVEKATVGIRGIYFDGKVYDTPVYRRPLLPEGAVVHGPAIVEETGSTTVIPPGWECRVDHIGNLLLES